MIPPFPACLYFGGVCHLLAAECDYNNAVGDAWMVRAPIVVHISVIGDLNRDFKDHITNRWTKISGYADRKVHVVIVQHTDETSVLV